MDEEKNIADLWHGQPLAESELDMRMVINQAQQFQRKVRYRNMTEYVATGALVIWAAVFAVRSEASVLVKVGVVLIGCAGLAVATILRLRGHAADSSPPLAAPTREVMRWHRSELGRQRDLLRRMPLWYLGPFVPGLALLLMGTWLSSPGQALRVGLSGALVALVFGGIALLNLKGARKLDEQIEMLGRELED